MMNKGKFGLNLGTIAAIAFVFGVLRQPEAVLLVVAFALLAERDEWLNRQAMQALLLTVTYYLADLVIGWLFGGLARLFGWIDLYGAAGAMGTAASIAADLLYIALIVLSVLAVLRLLRGKDAGLPLIAQLAGGDFVMPAAPDVAPVQPQPVPAAPPVEQVSPQPVPPPGYPVPEQTPPPTAGRVEPELEPAAAERVEPEPEPEAAARFCSACAAPLHDDSRFCTNCGAKVG